MKCSSWFRKKRAAVHRPRPYRPVLELLEARHLLAGGFAQVNLASDVPGLARVLDPNLVNPWGIASSPTGPFWFADSGSGVTDLLDGRGQPLPLVVAVPSPTGTVFNGGPGFVISANGAAAPSRFLFATKDGTISGWSSVVDPERAILAVDNSSSGAVYTGLALAALPGGSFLYAADFSRGTIDVFDQDFRPVVRPGSFQDPNLPSGFAPFNVQNQGGLLFVTYARQSEDPGDDVAGAGHGFIDVYDPSGHLVRRFASQGALNSPWGLALAPAAFGPFGGALLVGNNGDGRINAYDPHSGTFLGELADTNGSPIAIPDLWALTFGNGHAGGDANTLFFAAGVDYDAHGLYGALQAPDRRGADTAGPGAFDPNAPGEVGDYPLPPSGGPAFRATGADRPLPTSDLLPLAESSLVLVPTLLTISPPAARIETPVSVPVVGVSFGGSVITAGPFSDAIRFSSAAEHSPPERGAHHNAVALNSFLDWNALQSGPRKPAGVQRPGSNLHAVGAARSVFAARNAPAEGLRAEPYVAKLEAPASEEPDPGALPPAGPAEEVLAAVPSQSSAASEVEGAGGDAPVETQNRRGRTNLMKCLLVISIPMIWACRAVIIGIRKGTIEAGSAAGDARNISRRAVRRWRTSLQLLSFARDAR
jgi:uncharacterized protein (TIGR03118 family)